MISKDEFLRRLRKLPGQADQTPEIELLAASYRDIVNAAAAKGGVRVPRDPQATMREHLKIVIAGGTKGVVARREAANLYLRAANLRVIAAKNETLVKKAADAITSALKKPSTARTTGEAMKAVLAAWSSVGATPIVRYQNAIEFQSARRGSSTEKASPPLPANWGTFTFAIKGSVTAKQLQVRIARRQILPPNSRLLTGAMHPSLLKEGQ
jgi:hypothetical protein